jgi:hypothetical protein
MKKMKLIVAAILIITIGAASTAVAKSEARSLGKKAASDKKWRPVWQVNRKISGYKIKIHSGKPIVNSVQLLDSEKKKEFTYARYFGSGEVIKEEFGKPMMVGRIKVNMDKARGSKVELWIYTEKEKKKRVEQQHRDRNTHGEYRGGTGRYSDNEHVKRRRSIGRYRRYDDLVEHYEEKGPYVDDTHRTYPPAGRDPRIDRLRNYVGLGTISPALQSQTIVWYVGGRISGFDLAMEQGRARIESVRLISGDRVWRELEVRRYLTGGEALREELGPMDITRIEIDIMDNTHGAFSLNVRE